MTKKNKTQYQFLTDEDLKIIKSDPAGLTDYVVRTKIKDNKKSLTIIALIMAILAFGAGVFAGLTLARTTIPNNIVLIKVGDNSEKVDAVVEEPAEGK